MLRPGRTPVSSSLPTSYGGNGMNVPQGYGGYGNNNNNSNGPGSSYGGYSGGGNGGGEGYSGYSNSAAYGGYSNVVNNVNNDLKEKPGRKHRRGSNPFAGVLEKFGQLWIVLAFISIVLTITTLRYRSKYNAVLKILDVKKGGVKEAQDMYDTIIRSSDTKQRQITSLQDQHRKTLTKNTECENEKRKIMKEREELRNKHESVEVVEEKNKSLEREKAWKEQLDRLQTSIQRESRRTVTEKYGIGPHYVEVTVDITSLPEEESTRAFVIELASINFMPHAIHLFLEQVSHKLWDNAWFYINGPHVLQAGPQADEDEIDRLHDLMEDYDERELAVRPFREKNLESLSFPEYSNEYQHIPWTLGFTGRPGGPDFYINKVNNSESHGPGGQQHHSIAEFADACFARVYSGFDTLDAIFRSPIITDDPQYKYFFEDPVHIIKTTILSGPPIRSQHDMFMLQLSQEQIERELQLQKERQQQSQQQSQQQQQFSQQKQQLFNQQQQQTSSNTLPLTTTGQQQINGMGGITNNANLQAEAIGRADHVEGHHVEGHHKPKRHITMPNHMVDI